MRRKRITPFRLLAEIYLWAPAPISPVTGYPRDENLITMGIFFQLSDYRAYAQNDGWLLCHHWWMMVFRRSLVSTTIPLHHHLMSLLSAADLSTSSIIHWLGSFNPKLTLWSFIHQFLTLLIWWKHWHWHQVHYSGLACKCLRPLFDWSNISALSRHFAGIYCHIIFIRSRLF